MARIGTVDSRLVVVRGNSGSGKSSTARAIRERLGYGVAWVEQDYLRRTLLREHDRPNQPNIGLIDLTVRYALDQGYHVVLEGILYEPTYGAMVRQLLADHRGVTGVYYFQLPFEETIKRHSTRALANEVTTEQMRGWYQPQDLLGVPNEQIIDLDSTIDTTVTRILADLTWTEGGSIADPI
ncbi:kinase [Kribbella sandramycini]|uniref:Kinase n=1 Tax=Kribbella sandramycini TaxID=60450 RepID=A0A7Y4NZ12_9ACTN|nr:AAA family ATPase [Kribbella sandramycini]MBB6567906.1 putative kinase [Kribbella sandramycini]NOL39499.1 kinase [Kribbella sandramycini]